MLPHKIKEEILARLTERLKLYRVILFGSYVAGAPGTDSDIDLLVVTDDDFMPTTFEENMEHYLMASSALREIRRRVAVDLEELPSILSSAQRNRSRQSSKNMN